MPEDRKRANAVPIFKKGKKEEPGNNQHDINPRQNFGTDRKAVIVQAPTKQYGGSMNCSPWKFSQAMLTPILLKTFCDSLPDQFGTMAR